MVLDIAAIQYLYGANMNYHTGDDVYSFNTISVMAIWDAGGNDTISASQQQVDLAIDLTPGSYTSFYYGGVNYKNLGIAYNCIIENAIGGDGNDILTGNVANNSLSGGAGNDTLNGGAGADTVTGGLGDDTLDGGADDDVLNGGDGNDALTGGSGNDVLTGGAGNDTLDGGVGTDTMTGGLGDDTYIVDNAGDIVTENASEGTDTLQSSISYTILANVENLTLTGTTAIDATGNDSGNVLTGNAAANVLDGGLGNDTLTGGAGADTVTGGLGDDTLDGGADDDVLNGGDGNDALTGGSGNDVLTGGAGNDTAIFGGNFSQSTLTATATGWNVTGVGGNDAFSGVEFAQFSDQTMLLGNDGSAVNIKSKNAIFMAYQEINMVNPASLAAMVLLMSSPSSISLSNGVDKSCTFNGSFALDNYGRLTGGTITGYEIYTNLNLDYSVRNVNLNAVAAYNYGKSGNAVGLQKYVLSGDDVVFGSGGTDALNGWSGNDTLNGNVGNDTLNGGVGTDTMTGGLGDDTYIVDNAGDVVTENASEGNDLVKSSISYTLTADVENLTLAGATAINATGNASDNALTGNAAANVLNGGLGNDTMAGGACNDTYVVDSALDIVTELAVLGSGIDKVNTSLTSYDLSLSAANVENLAYTGTVAFTGTGNALANNITGGIGNDALSGGAGADRLVGGDGNDTLDGGAGADTLIGGLGDDTYVVGSAANLALGIAGDTVTELLGAGIDTVQSSISYTLGLNLDNLTHTGTLNLNGTGNTLDNILTGNSGNNTLNGGAGNDTLDGGDGNDTLIGGLGTDTLLAGLGDDTLVYDSNDIKIDGGAGTDILKISGANIVLDLSLLTSGKISGIEKLNLTGSGNNTLLVNQDSLLNLTGADGHDLYVTGNAGDKVSVATVAGGWTDAGITSVGGMNYHQYTHTTSGVTDHLYVQNTLAQNLV